MSEFVFLHPWWLLGALLCLVGVFFLNRAASAKSSWWKLMDEPIARSLIVAKGSHKLLTPVNLLLIALFAVCVALAGPSIRKQVPDELQGKASVIVLLANGDSMYAGDVTPNRNRLAKAKIAALVEALPESQFGLIAYDHTAHQVSPLTSDPEFLGLYLNRLEPNLMPDREFASSGFQDALQQAERMADHARYPVQVLLVTDGLEDEDVALVLEKAGSISVLAVGTEEGGALRFVEAKDVSGEPETKMPVARFFELKNQGGAVVGVTQNEEDINWLRDHILASADEANHSNEEFSPHDSGYLLAWLFLPLCLLLFRKQSWLFSFAPFLFLMVTGCTPVEEKSGEPQDVGLWERMWLSPDQLGQKALEAGDYEMAARLFEDPYRKGWTLYQAGEYEAAGESFRRVESAEAHFQLANCLARQEMYKEALSFYGKAIEERRGFAEAEHNAEIVKERMAKANKVSANERKVSDEGHVMLQVGSKGKVERKDQVQIDPLIYSEEELNVWLEKVKSSPEKLLKTKFELQSQEKLIDEP